MPINQSFSWWCFVNRGVDADTLLPAAKKIGFSAVELLSSDLFEKAHDSGLEIASHPGHRDISSGLNDLAQHDRIEEEIKANLDLALKFRIPTLITFSGERREGLTDEQGIENCVIGLQRLAPLAEAAGINLAMELLNSKVDHARYQCDKTPWGVEICEKVGSPRVNLLYDIYHMQIMEGDIIRSIRTYGSHFAHYHTAGNPGRRDMDDQQELCYPPIMRAILESGYSGYVGHEFVPKGNPVAALETAFRLCDV